MQKNFQKKLIVSLLQKHQSGGASNANSLITQFIVLRKFFYAHDLNIDDDFEIGNYELSIYCQFNTRKNLKELLKTAVLFLGLYGDSLPAIFSNEDRTLLSVLLLIQIEDKFYTAGATHGALSTTFPKTRLQSCQLPLCISHYVSLFFTKTESNIFALVNKTAWAAVQQTKKRQTLAIHGLFWTAKIKVPDKEKDREIPEQLVRLTSRENHFISLFLNRADGVRLSRVNKTALTVAKHTNKSLVI